MTITIRDVARRAGVAPITVSRVINNSGYVSQTTRTRVEAAIDELGYVPNMLGPSLRFKQTMTLAVVLTDITNPFWTTVTRGVEDIAQANGYSTILCNTDESEEKQDQYLHMLLRRRIDGMVLVPASSSPKPIQLLKKQGIPVVLLDRVVPDVDVDLVRADSESGAYNLTRYLRTLGHERIVMLSGPQDVSTAVDRANGFRQAMRDTGLEVDDSQILWGEYTQESGYRLAIQALQMTPPPTAVFAANNFIAIGAMRAFHDADLQVPDDIALICIDDVPPELTIKPFFTVARQPAREMGQQAARLLLDRVKGKATQPCQQIVLPTEMIIRASSGGPVNPRG